MREHFDRFAAEDDRRDAATPVRGHYDQIAPSRRGGIDDCLINVIVLDMKRLADQDVLEHYSSPPLSASFRREAESHALADD